MCMYAAFHPPLNHISVSQWREDVSHDWRGHNVKWLSQLPLQLGHEPRNYILTIRWPVITDYSFALNTSKKQVVQVLSLFGGRHFSISDPIIWCDLEHFFPDKLEPSSPALSSILWATTFTFNCHQALSFKALSFITYFFSDHLNIYALRACVIPLFYDNHIANI